MTPSHPLSTNASKPTTLTEQAYQQLRHDIVAGQFKPGEKLRVEALRNKYDIGATPIREALSRLSADGFVFVEGQRGFKVADMSMEDLEDVTNMRILLENQALTRSIETGDDTWEANILAAFHRLSKIEAEQPLEERDPIEWEKRNAAFHSALLGACKSKWLKRFSAVLYDQHRRYRFLARAGHLENRDLHKEHKAICDAALAHNAIAACDANTFHIRATVDCLKDLLPLDISDSFSDSGR